MSSNGFVIAAALSYGCAVVAYLAFAIRVVIGSRKSVRGQLLLVALIATAGWASACLMPVFYTSPVGNVAVGIAESVRYAVWYAFLGQLLTLRAIPARTPKFAYVIGAALLISTLIIQFPIVRQVVGLDDVRADYTLRLGLSVLGLVLVEQLVRRIEPQARWGIKPLAIALAGVFGFDLFFYADGLLFRQLDADIWIARGFANTVAIPFLAIATARNTGWTIDLHISRQAVVQSSALLISGTFLLATAGAGYFVRYFGGDWARALQIELLFAASLLLITIASSGRFRSWLKVFVSKHFFSYRYDYREEWLRFTAALSVDESVQRVQERTIMALADLVESPAGTLWFKDDFGRYAVAARCNMLAMDASESVDGELAKFLERTGWIINVSELLANPSHYPGLTLPTWLESFPSPWLIVPLAARAQLLGFVVLTTPRTAIDVEWEVRDLLKTASRQAASYLGQIRATEALLEARKFDAFNRMSAFVVHDLKNLIAQLSLMLKNATRHHDNPMFQADMLATVENVVARMNALMLQLRIGQNPVEHPHPVDVAAVVRRVLSAKSDSRISIELGEESPVTVRAHADRLEHVIAHLVQNALDASPAHERILVRVERDNDHALITVSDHGTGMAPEFVRERLFKPFQTTKSSGMGIGVYESVQYIAGLGGGIRVDSQPGKGTLVRVRLPFAEIPGVEAAREHVA